MKETITILLLVLLYSCMYAQTTGGNKNIENKKTPANPLAGTWRLVEFTDLDTLTGKWINRYGKNPRGYFTYTKTNILNLNISTDTPLKISEDSAKKLNVNLFDNIQYVSFGYFGTYSLDLEINSNTSCKRRRHSVVYRYGPAKAFYTQRRYFNNN